MEPRPHEVSDAIERLLAALDGMAAALASGELPRLLLAQEALSGAHIPSDTLRGWTDESRAELRTALRRARSALNGVRRTNGLLLTIVDACLAGSDSDYNRAGTLSPVTGLSGTESRVSCRV